MVMSDRLCIVMTSDPHAVILLAPVKPSGCPLSEALANHRSAPDENTHEVVSLKKIDLFKITQGCV